MENTLSIGSTVVCIKELRVQLDKLIQDTDYLISSLPVEKKAAGREIALIKTKLQEARMLFLQSLLLWAGQSLSHFDTGFVPSDVSK